MEQYIGFIDFREAYEYDSGQRYYKTFSLNLVGLYAPPQTNYDTLNYETYG
jgi:hypothetical protein